MKLTTLLLEVFDKRGKSLEELGVEEEKSSNYISYKFVVDGYDYQVTFGKLTSRSILDFSDIFGKYGNLNGFMVGLLGPRGCSTTGLGNFAQIYGYLIAIVIHILDTANPDVLEFEGFEPKMNAVYNKLMTKYSGNRYVMISDKVYINKDFIAKLNPDDQSKIAKIAADHNVVYTEFLKDLKFKEGEIRKKSQLQKLVGTLIKKGKALLVVMEVDEEDQSIGRARMILDKSGEQAMSSKLYKFALPLSSNEIIQPEELDQMSGMSVAEFISDNGYEFEVETPTLKRLMTFCDNMHNLR